MLQWLEYLDVGEIHFIQRDSQTTTAIAFHPETLPHLTYLEEFFKVLTACRQNYPMGT
jgi:hypothetical protein